MKFLKKLFAWWNILFKSAQKVDEIMDEVESQLPKTSVTSSMPPVKPPLGEVKGVLVCDYACDDCEVVNDCSKLGKMV